MCPISRRTLAFAQLLQRGVSDGIGGAIAHGYFVLNIREPLAALATQGFQLGLIDQRLYPAVFKVVAQVVGVL
ncbi:MAG: hypothetical protein JKX81_18865 [Arenicella sp.]|nr:hypothetical protein [Arenicella sp.]